MKKLRSCVLIFFLFFFVAQSFSQESEWLTQMPVVQESATDPSAESRDVFKVLPGFQVELLYSVPKDSQGSWVNITFDPQGRLVASDQGNKGLYRVIPSEIGSEEPTRVQLLTDKMSSAQGLLFAFDSLYLSVNGDSGSGFFRLRDTTGDDQFDEIVKLRKLRGGGEHGPHALRLSPDGKSIYIICGNHTDLPQFEHSRMLSHWDEDLLLPRQWDARGHARGRLAPGGWIAKTDPEGNSWEIISIGYRNAFDFAFNADGEIFTYDADMEWDMGMPWYRPTRICHAVSGSDFGWRSGTGKWPTYYLDSLPPVVDIGPGSPVGVEFGYGTKFPAKYQRALYGLDWTFGTIFAVHAEPEGASYRGVREEFVSRVALPLTDAAVGPDGALYFTVGGRGTDSALYRVTYVGDESTEPAELTDTKGKWLRQLRRELEEYHKPGANADLSRIWANLGHADRHIRFAARTALEHQPIQTWSPSDLTHLSPMLRIHAMAGRARAASAQLIDDESKRKVLAEIMDTLKGINPKELDKTSILDLLRAYALAFIRLGRPSNGEAAEIARQLDPVYPSDDADIDRELSRVLVYLNGPTVVQKTLALMNKSYEQDIVGSEALLRRNQGYGKTIANMIANQPELQKLHYAFVLRNMRYGWTLEERKSYFDWLGKALTKSGGASYQGFIRNIQKEAMDNLSDAERKAIESDVVFVPVPESELPKPIGPGRPWTMEDVLRLAKTEMRGRDFAQGARSFAAAKCSTCHRFDGNGGATGPDLTSVASRFSYKDLAEAMIHPSKVISDQYRASIIVTENGQMVTGRIVGETETELTVQTNPEDAREVKTIEKSAIEEMNPSKISLMPDKLLDVLNQEELLDLLAYLMSRGNPNDPMFAN